jgi:hypothetical protein
MAGREVSGTVNSYTKLFQMIPCEFAELRAATIFLGRAVHQYLVYAL